MASGTQCVVVAALVLLVLIVAALVALPYVALVRAVEYSAMYPAMLAPRVLVSEAYPRLKTGDILLFASACRGINNSAVMREFFSHSGLLLREGNLLYSSESSPGGYLMPVTPGQLRPYYSLAHGAGLYPLLARLKFYTGSCYLLRLSEALSAEKEEALKAEADRLHRANYDYPGVGHIIRSALGLPVPSRHCYQHVAHLLDVAGLAPVGLEGPMADAGLLRVCREVCALAGRPLPGGLWYHQPVQLVYDIDVAPTEEWRT